MTFSCDLKKVGGVACDSSGLLEKSIYNFGGKIRFDGKKIFVSGKSAGFFCSLVINFSVYFKAYKSHSIVNILREKPLRS